MMRSTGRYRRHLTGLGILLGVGIWGISGYSPAALGFANQHPATRDRTIIADGHGGEADGHGVDGHGVDTATTAPSFSLQYPQGSQVTVRNRDDIEIVSGDEPTGNPNMDIHTQARLLREDPADVVSQYIEQLVANDARVVLYRSVAVDGRSGFRIWLGERPDPRTGELKNSLVTFVGYGNVETAQIISYYTNDEAEAAVVALHDSFIHLAPPQ